MRTFTKLFIAAAFGITANASFAANYPQAGDFDGYYTAEAADFTLSNNAYSNYFKASFDFSIKTTKNYNEAHEEWDTSIIVNNFLYDGLNIVAEYDETTGKLKLKTVTLRPISTLSWLAISPAEGEWGGISALTANLLTLQIGEDGSVSIPDFSVGPYNNATGLTSVTASWGDFTVTESENPVDPDLPRQSSFAGSYRFYSTMTNFPIEGFYPESGITEDYVLEFTINEYGQVWTFDGVTQEEMYLDKLRNRGEEEGNVFRLYMDTTNGTVWSNEVQEDNEVVSTARLFGGRSDLWRQGSLAFTLTREEDGTFSMTPVSIFLRYQTMEDGVDENGNPTGSQNSVTKYSMIQLWENLEYIPSVESSVDGIEAANGETRYYNLQGLEVASPQYGQLLIKVSNGKVTREILRF